MDKQKQIEEMAKVICTHINPCKNCTEYDFGYCKFLGWCEKLYNAGYRKISEGVVVLTREEWDKVGIRLVQARKETAEKFAIKAKESFFGVNCIDSDEWNWYYDKLDEICEELSEGK